MAHLQLKEAVYIHARIWELTAPNIDDHEDQRSSHEGIG